MPNAKTFDTVYANGNGKRMIETMILSVTAFVVTNIDDLLMDTLLFAAASSGAERRRVFAGKYLGMGVLLAISVLGALGLQLLPQKYIAFLGVIPIALGVRELLKAEGSEDETAERSPDFMLNTALITVANGADNIGVYVPLFAGFAVWQILLSIFVFLGLIAVWCCLGKTLAGLPVLQNVLARYRKIMVPVVYIALGVYVLFLL